MVKVEVYTNNGNCYKIEAETVEEAKRTAEYFVERDTPRSGWCRWKMFAKGFRMKFPWYMYKHGYHRELASI